MTLSAMRVTIPEKLLLDMEEATRPFEIRPGADRDQIMYQAGRRSAFTWLCNKVGVNPLEVMRKDSSMFDHMPANAVPRGADER